MKRFLKETFIYIWFVILMSAILYGISCVGGCQYPYLKETKTDPNGKTLTTFEVGHPAFGVLTGINGFDLKTPDGTTANFSSATQQAVQTTITVPAYGSISINGVSPTPTTPTVQVK